MQVNLHFIENLSGLQVQVPDRRPARYMRIGTLTVHLNKRLDASE